jgi:autophagy-related protein 2
LLNDELDAGVSSASGSLFNDMRSSEMFSSCLSSGKLEQSMMSPATASSLNMHHLEAKCQNIHLELEVFFSSSSTSSQFMHRRSVMKLDTEYFFLMSADISQKLRCQGIDCSHEA